MSGAQISALFGVWSFVGFVLEVPSGALADRVSRRNLLVVALVVRAAGFGCWIGLPTFTGFALGFVLWGASGAASSGTWEALVYDELTRLGAGDRYTRFLGRAEALSAVGALAGTALAAPLLALGGYPAVGWASVAVCLASAALAARLPGEPPGRPAEAAPGAPGAPAAPDPAPAPDADAAPGPAPDAAPDAGYVATLRAGVREAVRNHAVGRVVLVLVVLTGLTAVEEYFGLLAVGLTSPATLPLLLLVPAAGYAVGAELGGRFGALAPGRVAPVVVAGLALFAAGALIRHPLGFVALGVGFGFVSFAIVVAAARLQETLTGPRATVTSVANVGEEVVALAVFGAFGAASGSVSLPVLTALATVPALALAVRIPRWLPAASQK